MDFFTLASRRQSVRRFKDEAVEREKIVRCLEAARIAPSTSNSQPWKFIVIDEPRLKTQLARQTIGPFRSFNTFVDQAPVLVAVLADSSNLEARAGRLARNLDFSLIDIGIAAEHFCLQATELGLGTCILGWFHERAVKKALGVPKNSRICLIVVLGYPQEETVRPKHRKPLEAIYCYNRYV